MKPNSYLYKLDGAYRLRIAGEASDTSVGICRQRCHVYTSIWRAAARSWSSCGVSTAALSASGMAHEDSSLLDFPFRTRSTTAIWPAGCEGIALCGISEDGVLVV